MCESPITMLKYYTPWPEAS